MLVAGNLPKSRRGTVTAWLVVSLAVIIAILAIGLDGGRMMEERRRVQSAADAAALAAAADLFNNYPANAGSDPYSTAQTAATTSAAANGYSNDGVNSVVTVNIPPTSGAFAGQAGYVEVIVRSNLQATFGAAITQSGLAVQSRAVARGQPQKLGVLLLNRSIQGAFSASGSASLSITDAPLNVNSSAASALIMGSGTIQASAINVSGGYSLQGRILGAATVNTGVSPTADPLRSVPAPQLANYPVQSSSPLYISSSTSVTLAPGIYQGGIHLSGSVAVTMQPGVYILNGGTLDVYGSASLIGNGVMIYVTNLWPDELDINGSAGVLTLTPPTSGPYQGISLFQDRLNNQVIYVRGSTTVQITGAIYAPAASVQVSSNVSGNTVGGAIIADSLSLAGGATVNVQMGNAAPPIPDCRLVE
jgi:hypothetical protein